MALKSIRINEKVHYGLFDYRPTPPTIIPTATGVVHSLNPGTLVISEIENGNLDEIQIPDYSRIVIDGISLCAVGTISQTKSEIALMVTDYRSVM